MIDLFGYLSYSAVLVGMMMLAKQNTNGWLVKSVGDAGWVALGFVLGLSSCVTFGLFFVLLNIVGYLNWRRKDKEELGLVKKRLAEGGPTIGAREFFRKLELD